MTASPSTCGWTAACLFASVAWTSTFAAAPTPDGAAPGRLNVLMIVVDDLNTNLGCYGHPLAQTPNIDRLAARGVRFERAYCQYPICNPSRTSLFTGRFPTATGVLDQKADFRKFAPHLWTLPQWLRRHGYFTARISKIMHDGLDDYLSWTFIGDELKYLPGHGPSSQAPSPIVARFPQLSENQRDDSFRDEQTADRTIHLLEHVRNRPFFLAVGLRKPHVPLVAPTRFIERFRPENVRLPESFASDRSRVQGAPVLALRENIDLFPKGNVAEQEARAAIAMYLACVAFADEQIGRILDALHRLELEQRTIVVLTSDHGWHQGEKGMWTKPSLYEPALRVPLIIAPPGQEGASKTCLRTVELLDLFPTLCELCRVEPPPRLDGVSMAPLLADAGAEWDRPAVSIWREDRGRSIRTERYRYTEFDRGLAGRELYDYERDPNEMLNVADSPDYSEVLDFMKRRLRERMIDEGAQASAFRLGVSGGARAKLTRTAVPRIEPQSIGDGRPDRITLGRYDVPLVRDRKYVLEFEARADANRPIVAQVIQAGAPFRSLGLHQSVELTTEFNPYRLEFSAVGDQDDSRTRFCLGENPSPVEIRNVVLRDLDGPTPKKTPEAPPIAPEDSAAKIDWHLDTSPKNRATLQYDHKYDRIRIVTLEHLQKNPADVRLIAGPWPFRTGGLYTVRLFVRADVPRPFVVAIQQSSKANRQSKVRWARQATSQWQEHRFDFEAIEEGGDLILKVGESNAPMEIEQVEVRAGDQELTPTPIDSGAPAPPAVEALGDK